MIRYIVFLFICCIVAFIGVRVGKNLSLSIKQDLKEMEIEARKKGYLVDKQQKDSTLKK